MDMSTDDDDDGDEEEKDDVHWEDGAQLCRLRAVLQEPWMTKALQHNNNNNNNNNNNTRARVGNVLSLRAASSPSTDAFSFHIVIVTALCQGLGVALADALARLLTRSPDPSDPLTQRRLTGLRRCVVAVMMVLGRVEIEYNKGDETGGGGGRGMNGQTTATAALNAGGDDGNDGLRLHPPVLRKLGQGHNTKINQQTASSSSSSSLTLSLSSMRRTVDAIIAFLANHRGGDTSTATTAASSLAVTCRDLLHLIDRTTVMVTADTHLEGNEGVLPHHHHQYQMGPSMAAVIDQVIQRHRRRYRRHPHPHPRRDDRDSNGNSGSHGYSGTSAGVNYGSNNNSLGLLADGDGDGLFWRQVNGSSDPLVTLMCAHYLSYQGLGRGLDDDQPMMRVLVRVINSAGFKLDACTLRLEVFSSLAFSGVGIGTGRGTKDRGAMTTDSSSTGGGGTSMVGIACSCVIMEDHYHQQQQYQQPTQALQRDDNSNSSGSSGGSGGNVVMMEYWQPGVAVEKVYHLQVPTCRVVTSIYLSKCHFLDASLSLALPLLVYLGLIYHHRIFLPLSPLPIAFSSVASLLSEQSCGSATVTPSPQPLPLPLPLPWSRRLWSSSKPTTPIPTPPPPQPPTITTATAITPMLVSTRRMSTAPSLSPPLPLR